MRTHLDLGIGCEANPDQSPGRPGLRRVWLLFEHTTVRLRALWSTFHKMDHSCRPVLLLELARHLDHASMLGRFPTLFRQACI